MSTALSTFAPKLTLNNNVDAASVSRIPEVVNAYRTDPLVHNKITTRLYAEWRRSGRMLGLLLRGPAEGKVRDFLLGDAAAGLKQRAESES